MDDAVIWASHIFYFSYNFFFSVATVLNTRDTIKYQYPPPQSYEVKHAPLNNFFSPSHLPCLQTRFLIFNPWHVCNLFWKIPNTFCPIFSVPLFHVSLHQDIWFQSQRMRKHWQFWQLEFNYFHLSLFQCAILTIVRKHWWNIMPQHPAIKARKHKVTIGNKEKNLKCRHFVICRNNFVWIRK